MGATKTVDVVMYVIVVVLYAVITAGVESVGGVGVCELIISTTVQQTPMLNV